MEPLDYCSNFLIGGYNSDGSTRLYSLVEEDELLASIRGRIMKKIALINPPFRGVIHRIKDAYPLGLGYIKAYCESKGVVCDLYDFSCSLLSDQALEEKYCLSDYDVIGVSSYSLFFSDTVVLIELLKKDRNIIVVGGHHATLCGSKILRDFPVIDFCLKGFGEKSFYDFISNIDTENVYSVSGLCYRKGDEFIDNPVNYEGIDINEFPVPDRGDIIVDASNYEFDATKRVFHISTSRGCPYHCTYCVNCKNNYWLARSELNVLEELNREFRGKGYKYNLIEQCFIMKVNTIQLHKYFPLTNTVEGEKVKGSLALDLEKCDLSIAFNYQVLTSEVVDLLQKDPDSFLCFYDFATEVRRKYNRMDFLVSCFSGLYFVFSRTINFLIINYGLQEIYLSCEKIISHYANELQSRSILDSFYRKNEVNLFHNTMKEIVDYFLSGCEKGNLYLQEINKFDENIYLYMTCGFETEMVFKLQCNVFDNMWNTNPTYYKIYRAGGKLYVERLAKE